MEVQQSAEVRPLFDGVITPKVYADAVHISNKDDSYVYFTSTSDGSQLLFDTSNISCDLFTDRRLEFEFEANVAITYAQNPPVAVDPYYLANRVILRHSPIFSTASNIEVGINGANTSYSASQFYEAYSRFNSGDQQESVRLSDSPVYHDYGFNTTAARAAVATPGVGGIDGYLGADNFVYSNLSYIPRGSITPTAIAIDPNNVNLVNATFRWREYLWLTPFTSYPGQGGMYNINNVKIRISLASDLKKLFVVAEDGANVLDAGFVVSPLVQANQRMRFRTINPPMDCPKILSKLLPAYNLEIATKGPSAAVNRLAQGSLRSDTISLSKVPSQLLAIVRRTGGPTFADPDTYARIDKLNITFGAKSLIFDNLEPHELWEQFVWDKGNKISYPVYQQFTGSPFMIEPAKDIPSCEPEGTPCCKNIQVSVTFTNLYNDASTFELIVLAVYDAVATYTRNRFTISDIVVNSKSIQEKAMLEYNTVPQVMPRAICSIGGSIRDDIINALSKITGSLQSAVTFYTQNKSWIDPLLNDLLEAGMSVGEAALALFSGGSLHPVEIFERLSMIYPQPELNKILLNMKEAGCMCCDYEPNWPVDYIKAPAGKMKKAPRKKKGGVVIETEDDFDDPPCRASRISLKDRS